MGLSYRPEIDGLRAVAVSAVVLYHAGLGGSGFVGVDVFFVISGYLITALLLREDRIDLVGFYGRRIRRIFPAALVVILATLAAAHLLLPAEAELGVFRSAAAAAIFVANLFFGSLTSGYFHADTHQMPLLHLWTLSVEEQFYLVWPLLLIVTPRRWLVPVLAGLAVASFSLSEWLMQFNPSAAFYQMPARFWELAAGGIIAAVPARPLPRYVAPVGLVLTMAACWWPLGHFPGMGALPAVLGACLVIGALHGGGTNRVLSSRPLVALGLISYSLYLWHWPLLAFYRATTIGEGDTQTRLMLCAVAVVLAIGTYRYAETPFRRMRLPAVRTVITGFGVMAALALSTWRYEPALPPEVNANYRAQCHPFKAGEPVSMQAPRCLSKEPKVVIWGDSQAHAWTPITQVFAERLQLPATTLAKDGCPPLYGVSLPLRSPVESKRCAKWTNEAVRYLQTNGADTVIIVARWHMFLGNPDTDAALLRSVQAVAPHVREIVVIGPTPELTDRPDKCAELGSDCAVSRDSYRQQSAASWAAIRMLESVPNVRLLDASGWLCDGELCKGIRDGLPLYSDQAHVAQTSARAFGLSVVPPAPN